jgi:hypothetical protein
MKSLLSWPALRQLAWTGLASEPRVTAHRLLVQADALSHARQAGWQPVVGKVAAPSLAPPEMHPAPDATGAQLLDELLHNADSSLLAQYYAGLAKRGLRIPDALLAAVLAEADRHRGYGQVGIAYHYPSLVQVLGERGRWLARLHPSWRDLLAVPSAPPTWPPAPPEARQEQRFWEMARVCLTLTHPIPNELQLVITLPQEGSSETQQDGSGQLPTTGLPRLVYLLERVSPHRWSAYWHLSPAQILALAAALPEKRELLAAWSAATALYQQADWAVALLEEQLTEEQWSWGNIETVRLLPPDQVAALVLPRVPVGARLSDPPASWQDALQMLRFPWPDSVLRRLVQVLEDSECSGDRRLRTAGRLMYRLLAEATAPAQCDYVEQRLEALRVAPQFNYDNVHYLSYLIAQLQLKRRVAQLFDTPATS